MTTVYQRIITLLDQHTVEYVVTRHAAVFTSEEAAAVRGTTIQSGAKALICKCDSTMSMFVMPADRRLASKTVRRDHGWRKLRFASREEVLEMTTLAPGSIPPFGSLFELDTYCDHALAENERINFNAGDHTVSISMRYVDYERVERPRLVDCGE